MDELDDIPGWCRRHIPHNLIAGGGLDSYGSIYGGRSDLGGSAGAHHGEIVISDPMSCPDCLALRRLEVERRAQEQRDLLASNAGYLLVKR